MKKHYLLGVLIACIFAGCKKDVVTEQPNVSAKESLLNVINVGGGGGSQVSYDAATNTYKAQYNGLQLEFSPVPTNANFREGDVVNTNITCTNCVSFTQTENGYFVGTLLSLPAGSWENIRERVENYQKEWKDFIESKKNADGFFKQPTLPEFKPTEGDGNGIATISGVVTRTSSTATTLAIMPKEFVVNPPATLYTATLNIGGVSGTYGGNNYYYDISIDPTSKVITNVTAFQMPGYIPVPGIVWQGSATITGSGINQLYYVTFTVIKEGNIMIEKNNHLITE